MPLGPYELGGGEYEGVASGVCGGGLGIGFGGGSSIDGGLWQNTWLSDICKDFSGFYCENQISRG